MVAPDAVLQSDAELFQDCRFLFGGDSVEVPDHCRDHQPRQDGHYGEHADAFDQGHGVRWPAAFFAMHWRVKVHTYFNKPFWPVNSSRRALLAPMSFSNSYSGT